MTLSTKQLQTITRKIIYLPIPMCVLLLCVWVFPYDINEFSIKDAMLTIATITGTITAIVFSMVLSIIERISSKYSTKFLRYILRNQIFIINTFYSIILILFCLFSSLNPNHISFVITMFAFTLFLELFIASLAETIQLMNPKYSILDPEVVNIKKWVEGIMAKEEAEQTERSFNQKACEVPSSIENQLEEKLLPIRDIVIKAISNDNLQEAVDGIDSLTKITVIYLRSRRNFYSNNDKFIYFIYSELQNIASNALKTKYLHLRIHPALIGSLEKIAKEALKVKVNPIETMSNNHLLRFPIQGIKILCIQNLNFENSSTPYLACETLERIGLSTLNKGYAEEGLSITQVLSQISNLTLKLDQSLNFLSLRSNAAIMKIAVSAAKKQASLSEKEHFDYVIKTMIDSSIRETVINTLENKKIMLGFYDPMTPIMCELYEFPKENNISNLAYLVGNLIYATNQPYLINRGLDIIRGSIYSHIFYPSIDKLTDEHDSNTKKVIDTLYVSQIYLLSTLNPNLRKSLLNKEVIINFEKQKVLFIFEEGINILWHYFKKNNRQQHNNSHTLDAIFSLLVICLIDKNTDSDLAKLAEKVANKIYKDYCSSEFTPQDTFFKYCRGLNKFINSATKQKRDIFMKVPKYKNGNHPFSYYAYGDKSLPFDDSIETAYFNRRGKAPQWKILGSYLFSNDFFNNLNNIIWNTKPD